MSKAKFKKINLEDLLEGILCDLDDHLKKCPIRGIALHSKNVSKDYLFFAIKGNKQDGNDFIDSALSRGASIILTDKKILNKSKIMFVPNLSRHIGPISARFFGEPSRNLDTFIVTGTNGKTTCVEMLSKISNLTGKRTGYISTIGVSLNGQDLEKISSLTTPSPVELQNIFFNMKLAYTKQVVVEASSHGLDQSRLIGTKVDTAILTSFSHDHLDYHGSMEEYSMAKKKLFIELDPNTSILNIDNDLGKEIYRELTVKNKNARVVTISKEEGADFVYNFSRNLDGRVQVSLFTPTDKINFRLNTVSRVLASNVICAIAALICRGLDLSKVYPFLEELKFPEGRMELITLSSKDKCFIDFAHTPEALESSLLELRDAFKVNIWCLFGCGGDRDKAKRPLMGKIAEEMSDNLVLTSDNPRREDEMKIISQITSGIQNKSSFKIIPNREEAISFCLSQIAKSKKSNVLLIAGKGHEKYQEIRGQKLLFNDNQIVSSLINTT